MSSILFELDTEVHDGLTVRSFAVSKQKRPGLEMCAMVNQSVAS